MQAYRTDIDGLRAIAVLLVALFHAGVPFLSGGFIGVDVFFVISGFLITGILYREIESGTFSIARFYERRARRILPILIVVLFTTAAIGWLLYTPREFELIGRSILASAFFINNVAIHRTPGGYFDPESDKNPLLHLWSLGVEEQFYLFFPALLFVIYRWKRTRVFVVLGLITGLSLIGSELAISWAPKSAFYFLHYRAWELTVGALVAIGSQKVFLEKRVSEVLAATGVLLILIPALFYDGNTRFPGVLAVPPVFGAALILIAGIATSTFVSRLLSMRPAVLIGQVSFSFYLWHWPLLIFGRHASVTPPNLGQQLVTVGVSLVLAYFTWRFVEQPLRRGRWNQKSYSILKWAAASLAIVVVFGHQIYSPTGFIRVHQARSLEAFKTQPVGSGDGSVRTILWGDSHAGHFKGRLGNVGTSIQVIYSAGCAPFTDVTHFFGGSKEPEPDCVVTQIQQIAERKNAERVVLAGRWDYYYFGTDSAGYLSRPVTLCKKGHCAESPEENQEYFTSGLAQTLASLKQIGKEVVILGPLPSLSFLPLPVTRIYSLFNLQLPQWSPKEEQIRKLEHVDGVLATLAAERGFRFISLFKTLCQENCMYHSNGVSLFVDSDHLSPVGANLVWRRAFSERAIGSLLD